MQGPTRAVLEATQNAVDGIEAAYKLQANQYIKLVDSASGAVRVAVGEALVFPRATEKPARDSTGAVTGVADAVNVNHETAVLVLSRESGQQRLITTPSRFIPGAYEDILEIRSLIRVQPHEVVIVQDNEGSYTFHGGDAIDDANGTAVGAAAADGGGTAFFLPPHSHLVTMRWAAVDIDDDGDLDHEEVTKIDLRAQYAVFKYTVRTSDNVELELEGTIFWQVIDVPTMIGKTGDPKGDVWHHARSALIGAVSGATLEVFMETFNALVTQAASTDPEFYAERGIRLHTLEVTSYRPTDAQTARVLQEIIQETTNRINRLQAQLDERGREGEASGGARARDAAQGSLRGEGGERPRAGARCAAAHQRRRRVVTHREHRPRELAHAGAGAGRQREALGDGDGRRPRPPLRVGDGAFRRRAQRDGGRRRRAHRSVQTLQCAGGRGDEYRGDDEPRRRLGASSSSRRPTST